MRVHTVSPGPDDLRQGSMDHHARLVRRFLDVPTAMVTLVTEEQQLFPGAVGLPEPWATERQTPVSLSMCQHVVRDAAPIVVADTRQDPRFTDHGAVPTLGVAAYAGWPLVDGGGHVVGALCAIDHQPREWTSDDLDALADLATACSAELQLRRARERSSSDLARAVVSAVGVAMVFYDHEDRLLLANDEAERIAAAAGHVLDRAPYAGPEVRRADRLRLVDPDDQIVPRALRGELRDHELEWIGPPGDDQVAVTASSQRLRRADGSVWGTLVVMHDVTDLAIALEVKERFTATVSHELRTPLTAILGFAELLTDDLDPEDPRQRGHLALVARIESSAQKLRRRVSDLLDAADRRRTLDLRALDLAAHVRRTVDVLAPQVSAAGLALETTGDDEHWATADSARIEQAVENLVSNAVKYNRPGGRVAVGVRAAGDRVRVEVRDDGVGMSPSEVALAFERHWRGDAARASDVPGVGIGLALVQEIAAEHHGIVEIDSTPGVGTTVTLALPRVPS